MFKEKIFRCDNPVQLKKTIDRLKSDGCYENPYTNNTPLSTPQWILRKPDGKLVKAWIYEDVDDTEVEQNVNRRLSLEKGIGKSCMILYINGKPFMRTDTYQLKDINKLSKCLLQDAIANYIIAKEVDFSQ